MGYYNGPVTRKEDLSRISSAAEEEESFGVFSLSRDALLVRQSTEIASSHAAGNVRTAQSSPTPIEIFSGNW